MNIFTLIDKLRKARRQHSISAAAQGLYHELIGINNDERWSDTFKSTNMQLCAAINTSEKTLRIPRDELLKAGLITYESGQSKRLPGVYSLFGVPLGVPIGGKIYHQSDSQKGYQIGSKTPDLLRDKNKEIDINLKGIEVVVSARTAEIENAVQDFCNGENEEKEKSCAKKENDDVPSQPAKKAYPTLEETVAAIEEKAPGQWRNVLQHYVAKGVKGWSKLPPEEQQPYYDRRLELFTNFYEYKEDQYRIRYPTIAEMATNFYHWTEIQINKSTVIKQLQNGTATNVHPKHSIAPNRATRNKNKRNELLDLSHQSTEFLRRTAG